MKNDSSDRRASVASKLVRAWLHLAVLWTLGFAWPLFEVLRDGPDFFVARGNTSADIVILALVATLVPPLVLVLGEALLLPWPRARRALHLVLVGLLMAAIVLQVVGDWGNPPWILPLAVSLAVGAAGAIAYARTRVVPSTLSVLAPAPLLALAAFLLLPPISDLLFESDQGARAATGTGNSTPVVMVIFDEFAASALIGPDERVDASRFPGFAQLARDGTWYRNATTVADQTSRAVPAVLSGLRPERGSLPIVADYPRNLFTALSGRYAFNASEPVTDLCPERLCAERSGSQQDRLRALVDDLSVVSEHMLLPKDLRDSLPAVDRTFAGFRNSGRDTRASTPSASLNSPASGFENREEQFERFLARIRRPTGRPPLDFIHVELPHTPWEYLPDGRSYPVAGSDIPGLFGDQWYSDPWFTTQAYARYLLQVGSADRLVQRLIGRLRGVELYDRALIVVTADHGVSFRPGLNRRIAKPEVLPDIANVPLFVKLPHQPRGRTDGGPAETIDIHPTVLSTIGLRPARQLDGAPLPRPAGSRGVVRVEDWDENYVTEPLTRLVRGRDAEVERRVSLLGGGDGWASLFAAGDGGDLVGRRPAQLADGGGASFRVALDYRPEYFRFSPEAPVVPAFVTGRLSGDARAGDTIAVAVDGRIVAVTRSYVNEGEVRMGALVPASAFRTGANRVEAFQVGGTRARPRLASAGVAEQPSVRLSERDRQLTVEGLPGGAVPVEPGAAAGYVDKASAVGERLVVSGWATDAAHKRSADRVLVFVGRRLVQATRPQIERPDLADQFGAGAGNAGFKATWDGAPGDEDPDRLVVLAVADGRASRLDLPAS